MADNPHSIQITPDGTLSKCEHYIFDHTVGDLEHGITNQAELRAWQTQVIPDYCKDCPLIPDCVYPQFCPTAESICYPFERENRIQGYKRAMVYYYEHRNDKTELAEKGEDHCES